MWKRSMTSVAGMFMSQFHFYLIRLMLKLYGCFGQSLYVLIKQGDFTDRILPDLKKNRFKVIYNPKLTVNQADFFWFVCLFLRARYCILQKGKSN